MCSVLANAEEERRLALAHPVHAHEVEAFDLRDAAGLHRPTVSVEDGTLDPRVVRTEAVRPEDRPDPSRAEVELARLVEFRPAGTLAVILRGVEAVRLDVIVHALLDLRHEVVRLVEPLV